VAALLVALLLLPTLASVGVLPLLLAGAWNFAGTGVSGLAVTFGTAAEKAAAA
jgi:hypothetical protein